MRLFFALGIFFVFDVAGCHSSFAKPLKTRVLKRVTRHALDNIIPDWILFRLKTTIISNCAAFGHTQDAGILQETYDNMSKCIENKKMLVTPKDEFIAHIEDCSPDAINNTKHCLPKHQIDFPEFLLDLVKSIVTLMYDNNDYLHNSFEGCAPKLNTPSAQHNYIRCITSASLDIHRFIEIPTSKSDFCRKFLPVNQCFADMLKDNCDETTGLQKFIEDYINTLKIPCEKQTQL